jgi:hypothetical protein
MIAFCSPSVALPEDTPRQALTSIKVLDLLTNRYHVGIVHAASETMLDVEMPLAARLSAGQRIHFALSDESGGIVARRAMRSALVRQVQTTAQARLRIDLTPGAECVAA